MKVQITISVENIELDQTLTATDANDLFQQFRQDVTALLPFFKRQAAKLLSDYAFMVRVIDAHNHRKGTDDPVPADAVEFLAFGERHGYVKRLEP